MCTALEVRARSQRVRRSLHLQKYRAPNISCAGLSEFGVGQLHNNQVRALRYMVYSATVGEVRAAQRRG
jgi:hypothetical protein